MTGKSTAATVGLAFGAFYTVLGVVGFLVTGFGGLTAESGDALLGISLNPFHNIAHLGIGAFLLIMCSQKNTPAAEGAVMGVGLFYVVAFVIGVIGAENLSILNLTSSDELGHFFHLLSGVVLLTIGLMSSAQTHSQMKRRGLA
ncbi:MAG TPA: DUF4383 domain-containing protein [Solirubrobacteraceae bacterium]|nr:DUF4383 domain-containing protein [Solirubrobacteraceae bacterium]